MKISEVEKHLKYSKIDKYEIDVTRVIVHDEFSKKDPTEYRIRAIKRLLDMRVEFSSDSNIVLDMAKSIISIACPYDESKMEAARASGNFQSEYITYRCPLCRSEVTLALLCDGITISPKASL